MTVQRAPNDTRFCQDVNRASIHTLWSDAPCVRNDLDTGLFDVRDALYAAFNTDSAVKTGMKHISTGSLGVKLCDMVRVNWINESGCYTRGRGRVCCDAATMSVMFSSLLDMSYAPPKSAHLVATWFDERAKVYGQTAR